MKNLIISDCSEFRIYAYIASQRSKNKENKYEDLKKIANILNPQICIILGILYSDTTYETFDSKEAFKYFEMAERSGQPYGRLYLGYFLTNNIEFTLKDKDYIPYAGYDDHRAYALISDAVKSGKLSGDDEVEALMILDELKNSSLVLDELKKPLTIDN